MLAILVLAKLERMYPTYSIRIVLILTYSFLAYVDSTLFIKLFTRKFIPKIT